MDTMNSPEPTTESLRAGQVPAPPETVVRLSCAAYLAHVSVRTAYSWVRRGLLVDVRGPDRVAGVTLANISKITGQTYTWANLAAALTRGRRILARPFGAAQEGTVKRGAPTLAERQSAIANNEKHLPWPAVPQL